MDRRRIVLVLAGGNALGAYQAGVYQALHHAGVEPDWIVGTSAGAINGALIAGNPPDQRLARLAAFWRPGPPGGDAPRQWDTTPDVWRRTAEVVGTLLTGRAGMFAALGSSLFSRPPAIYDTDPLANTLSALVDLDRLNGGAIRYSVNAVDLDSGEEVLFDSREHPITVDHIRASAALPPAFPPIAIDGRLYVDGGLAENLALDPVLSTDAAGPMLCIAVDLLPRRGSRPDTIGAVMSRTQDLMFASQSRRAIDRWQQRCAATDADGGSPVTLVHLTYDDQQPEVAGKAMDFSPQSVRRRWDAGANDASALIRWLTLAGTADERDGSRLIRSQDLKAPPDLP